MRHPTIRLSSYIDDDTILGTGDKAGLLRAVSAAAADFHHMFQHELKADISESKAVTVASSAALAKSLAHQLR
eukprot:5899758-Pyramimonas_sp.AAC.1